MTGLSPHLARTLTDDRRRRAEQHRLRRSVADDQASWRPRPRPERRPHRTGDEALETTVAAAAGGDPKAWTALEQRFASRVRGVARKHRLGEHDVNDVVQATWLRLYEHIAHLRDPSAIGAWLETTARNESVSLIRLRARERPMEHTALDEPLVEPVDDRWAAAAERRKALVDAILRLPRRQRRLLVAMLLAPATSYADLAAALDVPIGSIGPTRARSIERLRRDGALARAVLGGIE